MDNGLILNGMPENKNITIGITQAESKRALALEGHLRLIFSTVFNIDGNLIHPLSMNQADLLLCSASLRILFFDDSPSPILLDFLKQHHIQIEVETFETDLAMLFFAQVDSKETGHVCDLCWRLLFDREMREYCELGKTKSLVAAVESTSYETIKKRPDVWSPAPENDQPHIGFSNLGGPIQLCNVTRKRVQIDEWGDVRLGYLKDIPIRRKTILKYVANTLGGVHYNSRRLPSGKDERSEFKMLAEAYDWENQAIMHAGLVAVAIACIEIATHPQIREIMRAVGKFNHERQLRLSRGDSPVWGDSSA